MKHPPWIRVKLSNNEQFVRMRNLVSSHHLHTVCESASCPNIGECWGRGTATFMILGNRCTRHCGFCDVAAGQPEEPDSEEPDRVAEAVRVLGLKHAVITSVTRDDLPDGGASLWAETIRRTRAQNPECCVEVLIPDLQGDQGALQRVFDAKPDVLGHNVETVPRLYPLARPQADYARSLWVIALAKQAGLTTKSGVMLGMGESLEEVLALMQDLQTNGCDILTAGQYLQPTPQHVPIQRYWTPKEFQQLQDEGLALGFRHVEAGPLVRSSYHAEQAPHY
jgi:lipoic acid synthetase